VVEGALDVRLSVRDVLSLLAPYLLHGGAGACLRRHKLLRSYFLLLVAGLLLAGLLLVGHDLLRTLARTRVRAGPLAAHRNPAAMADALVAADLDLAPDVGGDLAAQITLDPVVRLDEVAERDQLFVGQVLDPLARVDAGSRERRRRAGP